MLGGATADDEPRGCLPCGSSFLDFWPALEPTSRGFFEVSDRRHQKAEETPSASPGILGQGRRSTGLTRTNSTGSVCKVGWVFLYILAPVPPNPHTSDIGIPGQHRDVCQQIVELSGLSEQLNPGAAVSTT